MQRPAVRVRIRAAEAAEAGELFVLQRAAFVAEGQRYDRIDLPPLRDTPDDVRRALADPATVVLVAEATDEAHGRPGRLLGSARMDVDDARGVGLVGRIVVAPDVEGRGLGSRLLEAVHQQAAQRRLTSLELFTGAGSERNLRLYRRHGYVDAEERHDDLGIRLIVLRRPVTPGG